MAETLYEGDESDDPDNKPRTSESLTPGDLTSGSGKNYVYMNTGEELLMEVDTIDKAYPSDDRFTFSDKDYAYEITDTDGDTYTVNTWGLWFGVQNAVQSALDAEKISENDFSGLNLHLVNHEERGEYTVKWKAGDMDEFEEVEAETDG